MPIYRSFRPGELFQKTADFVELGVINGLNLGLVGVKINFNSSRIITIFFGSCQRTAACVYRCSCRSVGTSVKIVGNAVFVRINGTAIAINSYTCRCSRTSVERINNTVTVGIDWRSRNRNGYRYWNRNRSRSRNFFSDADGTKGISFLCGFFCQSGALLCAA